MEENTLIFGIRAVQEALLADKPIDKVYVQLGLQGANYQELSSMINRKGIATSFVPLEKLNTLTKFQNHQGIVAKMAPVEYVELEALVEKVVAQKEKPLFLLLDQITDVRNFGAIIRTAECTGVDGIIVPKTGSATLGGAGIKTSAGAIFKIPLCKVDHLKDAVYYLQAAGIKVVAATEKTEQTIYEVDLSGGVAIVMGAEDRGINPSVLKVVDEKAKLPLLGEIDSLNVSVACGAVLYEVVRQRGFVN
jgi:23S rRNA (guanosine2251-2'-O)-methyltransferase